MLQAEQKKTRRIIVPLLNERYEQLIRSVYGAEWRSSPNSEIEGALGLVMVKAVLDGVPAKLERLADYFGIDSYVLNKPYDRLQQNGYMSETNIKSDRGLINGETFANCWVAGIASGSTGKGSWEDNENS